MAIICLTSASGSPGVTTTALGLAFCWPRPVVLVEADPTGGSGILAGFLRGTTPYDAGLLDLALSPLDVGDALRDVLQPLSPSVTFVAGTRSHAQAAALRDVWEPLVTELANLDSSGQDVIVDAGRLGLAGSPTALIDAADISLMVARATLPAIAAARSWAETVRQPMTGWRHPALLLVGEGDPYRGSEVSKVLGLPVVADLPDDPACAAVYHRGAAPPKNFENSRYIRALRAASESIRAQVARSRFALVEEASL